jgi:hypothetical protein
MNLTQKQIIETLRNTPSDYMEKSLQQRNPGPLSAGSTFHKTQSLDSLCQVKWIRHEDPDCAHPAISFRGQLSGKLGIAPLENMNLDQIVYLRPAHKGENIIENNSPYNGQKATEVVGDLSKVDSNVNYTTLLLGPSDDSSTGWAFWTLFPGPCSFQLPEIGFESLSKEYEVDNGVISMSVARCLEIGFKYVKHVTEYKDEN